MPEPRPELIFVNGPQKGERAVLMANVAVLGRSPTSEVLVKEEFASRQHVRFELTAEGWVIENLSPHGTRVNGKKYRHGKKLILETGDVVGMGVQTEILFVSPGDDPEAALRTYHEANPTGQQMVELDEVETAPAEAKAPAPGDTAMPLPAPAPAPAVKAPGKQEPAPALQAADAEIKKYIMGFGIYLILMVGVIILLKSVASKDVVSAPKGPPAPLGDRQIEELLRDAKYQVKADPLKAKESLDKAILLYQTYRDQPGNLYKSVKYFKLHLTYKRSLIFDRSVDEDMYKDALDKLVKDVKGLYRSAYTEEQAKHWRLAWEQFKLLQEKIPAKSEPYPEDKNDLFDNILLHLTYVSDEMGAKRR